jgi:hypothetical protein
VPKPSKRGDLTFLVNEWGRPFTDAGFGNWFRDRCIETGVPGRAHGLRKAGAIRHILPVCCACTAHGHATGPRQA